MPDPDLADVKVIFVMGGPGSGKGTQCSKIVEKYGFNHLSSGDLLRAEVESGSAKGEELKSIMAKGELVSLDEVLNLLKKAMKEKAGANKGFLIDGYPRELDQGKRFEAEIVSCQCVLMFDVSEEVMKQRLLKRGESSGRADDNEATIVKRFETFKQFTVPVVEYYEQAQKMHKFDASKSVDDIFAEVVTVIDGLKMS